MTTRQCPLGDDCDLTVAWMAGAEDVRQTYRAKLDEAAAREGLARYEADQLRMRADAAENRCHELWMALDQLRPLVFGANRHAERYPRAVALLKGEA
jgi:hypothetical protein